MSVLSELDSLVLRDTSHPPLTNKGSELTYAEWDARVTAMYDVVQSVVSGANVTPYDAGTTYDASSSDIYKQFAGYGSRIWKAIGSHSGQTPSEGIYWTQVTLAELIPDVLKVAENADSNGVVIKEVKLDIASANVLTLNTMPIELIPAQGAGTAIEILSANLAMTFNSVAYAVNTNIELIANTGVSSQAKKIISQTVDSNVGFIIETGTSEGFQLVDNEPINVYVPTGNPTLGNSDITIYATYRVITL